jgi:cation transport ATPase
MTGDSAGHDLEARVEALRRELAALIVTLCSTGQRLEDLADELRSRRQMNKVLALVPATARQGRPQSGHPGRLP